MIIPETNLLIKDNSGALKAQCIKVLNKSIRKPAKIGTLIVVTIKKIRNNKKIEKSSVQRAFVLRTKKDFLLKEGTSISFSDNAIILVDNKNNPLASRVKGPTLLELKKNKKLEKVLMSLTYLI